jgi:hypothetical protein
MKEVLAYQDDSGNLHRTVEEAVRADFITMFCNAWAYLPTMDVSRSGVELARILTSGVYPSAGPALIDALEYWQKAVGWARK